jgi:hypothetical protein
MPSYRIYYIYEGEGHVDVITSSKEEAEELFHNKDAFEGGNETEYNGDYQLEKIEQIDDINTNL